MKPQEPIKNTPKNNNTEQSSNKENKLYKPLSEIVQLDKFKQESPDNITLLWNKYYSSKERCISGVMSVDFYNKIFNRAKTYPMVHHFISS
jgi:hypothetical protein